MQKRVITQRGEAWEETWKRTKQENVWSCEGETYFGGCCFFLQVLLGRGLYTQTLHGALFGQAWYLRLHCCALAQPLCSRNRKHTAPPSVIVIMLTVIEHMHTHTHSYTCILTHTHPHTYTLVCTHAQTHTLTIILSAVISVKPKTGKHHHSKFHWYSESSKYMAISLWRQQVIL